jgi:GxxExxY protein
VFICVHLCFYSFVAIGTASEARADLETQMNTNKFLLNQISEKIIGCAFVVSNTLGAGFLEKVYENALSHELRKAGLTVEQQHSIAIHYDGVVVGIYTADLLVENALLVELKAVTTLDTVHRAQCINYLKGSGLWLCLLLNFGSPRLEIRRVVGDPS